MKRTLLCLAASMSLGAAQTAQAVCTTTGDANNQVVHCENYQFSQQGQTTNLSSLDSLLSSAKQPAAVSSPSFASFSAIDFSSLFHWAK
jgi:hypothetical protein